MNIGVRGGTFDPFHRGHLDPVLAIRNQMAWERVLFVRTKSLSSGRFFAAGIPRRF